MTYFVFFLCCFFAGIAHVASAYGNGNLRYENGNFTHNPHSPEPYELMLFRPQIFCSGIGMLIFDVLSIITIFSVIALFIICIWKLEWYIPIIGITTLTPIGNFIGKLFIKSFIGGITSPLSNIIVISLTIIFTTKVLA